MQTQELIHELPKGLIKWYEFHAGSRALYVSTSEKTDEPLIEALKESGLDTETILIKKLDEVARQNLSPLANSYECIVI